MQFNILEDSWKSLFHARIVSNEWAMAPLLHYIIGVINPVKYIFGGQYISTRFHQFWIQQSGTGKGEMMKLANDVFAKVGSSSFYTTKPTEAALVGTVYTTARRGRINILPREGLLSRVSAIMFDEGGVILEKYNYMEALRDYLNMAMDEHGQGAGFVTKQLAGGGIAYPTWSSILAGTIYKKSVATTVFEEGMLQRMFVVFKDLSEKECAEISAQLEGNTDVNKWDYDIELQKFVNNLKIFINSTKAYESNNTKFIRFSEESLDERRKLKQQMYDEILKNRFKDDKQKILLSFYSRSTLLCHKAAVQHAVVEEKKQVDIEDYKYAIGLVSQHLSSVVELLDMQKKQFSHERINRQNFILDLLQKQKFTKMRLLKKLQEEYRRGNWDLGVHKSRKLIDELIFSHRISEIYTKKNTQQLSYSV